ncbi:MAG TPA: PEP-CTERM system histidine kinase PrsK [Desulfuromonadales bacterium]|nr:PEP-CTERM system histidine kinase PrsK [Desulfuromonadales bacterium]
MITDLISILAVITLLTGVGYLLYSERSRTGFYLGVALSTTALVDLFDLLSLNASSDPLFWKSWAMTAEALLPFFWLLCSLTLFRQSGPWQLSWKQKTGVALTALFLVVQQSFPLKAILYAPDFPAERLLFLADVGFYYYVALLICLIIALVNFEITFVNASPDAVWKIKYELIGLGIVVAIQVFYYSQALLYRSLNMNYLSLRSFLYLVAASLIAYSLLFRRGKGRVQVSRQVAFKSVIIITVGIYLILLGILGKGMQYVSSFFSRNILISLVFITGTSLLILLLSDRFKRKLKVQLHKNFYQYKHDYRTQWLRFTEQLSSSCSGDELIQHILSAYCDIFGITGSALFLRDATQARFFAVADYKMPLKVDTIEANNSLVTFIDEHAWVMSLLEDLPDIKTEDSDYFRENGVFFVVPLFNETQLEGFIVLARPVYSKEVFIYEDYDLMKTISRQAFLAIMHQRLSEQVIHASEIQAIGNVATFVAHDLKNHVSSLSLIVENAARHIHNPEFQKDMLTSLGNTVTKMQKLIGRLKNLGEHSLNLRQVNLLELCEKTAHSLLEGRIAVSGTSETAWVDEVEIQKVVLNLLMNGIEASGKDEPVLLEVGNAKAPFIRVSDKGCGMSSRYIRTELFKPFRTTKKKGLGIGLYQCSQIMDAHGGRIEVTSREEIGTVFTVWFADMSSSEIAGHTG